MYTISNILEDIQRKTTANNMIETCFSYRLVYFVNSEGKSEKHYVDVRYDGLRSALESIIRGNLTTTNTIVLAATTARKSGETVSLLSRSYAFSLNEYFQKLCEAKEKGNINSSYGRRRAQWG